LKGVEVVGEGQQKSEGARGKYHHDTAKRGAPHTLLCRRINYALVCEAQTSHYSPLTRLVMAATAVATREGRAGLGAETRQGVISCSKDSGVASGLGKISMTTG